MCEGCKWYLYDSSTDASDCMKAEDMTEQEFETYFIDDKDGCPCYKELVAGEDYPL